MTNEGDGFVDARAQVLARLAVLQRMCDQAMAGNRAGVPRSIEHLIEEEAKALRELRDVDGELA